MRVLSIDEIVQGVKEDKLKNKDLVYVRHKDLIQNTEFDEYFDKYHIDNIYFKDFSSKTFYFNKTTNEQITDKFMLQRIEYIEDMQLKLKLKQFFEENNIYPESCLLYELEVMDAQ